MSRKGNTMSLRSQPDIGTIVECSLDRLTNLNSKRPVVRLSKVQESWVAIDPSLKRGLIVFLDGDVSGMTHIEVTKIGENLAFAQPRCNTV